MQFLDLSSTNCLSAAPALGYILLTCVPLCVSMILSVPASEIEMKFPASTFVEKPITRMVWA